MMDRPLAARAFALVVCRCAPGLAARPVLCFILSGTSSSMLHPVAFEGRQLTVGILASSRRCGTLWGQVAAVAVVANAADPRLPSSSKDLVAA